MHYGFADRTLGLVPSKHHPSCIGSKLSLDEGYDSMPLGSQVLVEASMEGHGEPGKKATLLLHSFSSSTFAPAGLAITTPVLHFEGLRHIAVQTTVTES